MREIVFINGSPKRNGATDEIQSFLIKGLNKDVFECNIVNLSDYIISYCTGCTTCYQTSKCWQEDEFYKVMSIFDRADIIVTISPSYWADITGTLKVFIDRCTSYCNTHEHHAVLSKKKKGFAVALRTGQNPSECLHIIDSINHFYGHLKIDFEDNYSMYLCGINRGSDDVSKHKDQINQFSNLINCTL